MREDVIPTPIGPYGESKIAAENYILDKLKNKNGKLKLHDDKKQVYILRPCMIHGPVSYTHLYMKQIIQDLKSGQTILEEVPVPQVKSCAVLIQTTCTLVSLGTERMLVEFGKANLIEKARQQPDKVKQVLDKIKTDGLQPTLEAIFNKLGQPDVYKRQVLIMRK